MPAGDADRRRQVRKRTLRPLERACRRVVAALRHHCPCLIPQQPLEAGAVTDPIRVPRRRFAGLVNLAGREAVLTAAGLRVPADPDLLPRSVLWQEGADALLLDVAGIDVRLGDGLVSVRIPVRCDQLPETRGEVLVDFVMGTPERPTGLLAAATEPRGPRTVVRRWGDALTALAWQAVLDASGGVAGAAGTDRDGAALVPAALTASRAGIAVLAQARHEIDRVRLDRVVRPAAEGRP